MSDTCFYTIRELQCKGTSLTCQQAFCLLEDVLSNSLLTQEGIQFTMFVLGKRGLYSAFLHLMGHLMLLACASYVMRVLDGSQPPWLEPCLHLVWDMGTEQLPLTAWGSSSLTWGCSCRR